MRPPYLQSSDALSKRLLEIQGDIIEIDVLFNFHYFSWLMCALLQNGRIFLAPSIRTDTRFNYIIPSVSQFLEAIE